MYQKELKNIAVHDFIFIYNAKDRAAKNIQPFRSLWVNLFADFTVFGAFLPCIAVYYIRSYSSSIIILQNQSILLHDIIVIMI